MTDTNQNKAKRCCPSCGAPIVSEICAYCGTATGLDTAEIDMEYPVLECKEVAISFWSTFFPLIFAGAFGIPGLTIPMVFAFAFENYFLLLIGIPFIIVGAVASFFVIRSIYRNLKTKKCGKIIQGTVYGYIDDNVRINGQPAQIVKLLVNTKNGPRFILYRLGSTLKVYGIYDKVDIIVYKNYFLISKNNEIINW